MRAGWLANLYQVDKDRVTSILRRTRATASTEIMGDFFTYYEWSPSLEKALLFGRPGVVLKVFEIAELDAIREWLSATEKLMDGVSIDFPDVEELCRWEDEKHLLPD